LRTGLWLPDYFLNPDFQTMESFMIQQRNRKSFVEYDDLKVLEQHLADYLTLQTPEDKNDKTVSSQFINRGGEQTQGLLISFIFSFSPLYR
jgi:hypothetical protein